MIVYLSLCYEFLQIGFFAIGGGMATIPFLMNLAQSRDWFTPAGLTDMIAVSESTPGPIGINMATYAGFEAGGIVGGLVATFSLVLPSVVIICMVSHFLKRFRSSRLVEDIFYGLRPASAAMITGAMAQVLLGSLFLAEDFFSGTPFFLAVNWFALLLFGGILACTICFRRVHPIVWIGISALCGILLQL